MITRKSEKAKNKPQRLGKSSKRGETDTLQVGKGEFWFGVEARTWYILFGLSVIISIILYPNILISPVIYRLGDVADRDIKSTHEFLVEDNELTEKNRRDAVKKVLPVYDFDRTATNVASRRCGK